MPANATWPATISYAPGRRPMVQLDCLDCSATGIGQGDPNTSRCTYCRGRGWIGHDVDIDCDCLGCRTYRGEVCDECGAERELDEDRYRPCAVCV